MSPELTLLALNAATLLVAYTLVYPRMAAPTAPRLMRADLVVTAASLGLGGWLFAGQGLRFDMLLFETRWWVFALLTAALIETPLVLAFCKARGIPLRDFDVIPGPGRRRGDGG